MDKKDYRKQLSTKEWKFKRLQILERDSHTCQKCGAKENLHVHHLNYIKGKKAWEHPDSMLITLCGDCHMRVHNINKPHTFDNDVVYNFIQNAPEIWEITSAISYKLLFLLATYLEDNSPIVRISSEDRVKICGVLKISTNQLTNALKPLKAVGLVVKNKQEYILNPLVFWKGSLVERATYLQKNGESFLEVFNYKT